MDLSSEPEPKGQFYYRVQVVSYRTASYNLQTLTFSSRPWRLTVEYGYQIREPIQPVARYVSGLRP